MITDKVTVHWFNGSGLPRPPATILSEAQVLPSLQARALRAGNRAGSGTRGRPLEDFAPEARGRLSCNVDTQLLNILDTVIVSYLAKPYLSLGFRVSKKKILRSLTLKPDSIGKPFYVYLIENG